MDSNSSIDHQELIREFSVNFDFNIRQMALEYHRKLQKLPKICTLSVHQSLSTLVNAGTGDQIKEEEDQSQKPIGDTNSAQ
jgi:hypothetical protein